MIILSQRGFPSVEVVVRMIAWQVATLLHRFKHLRIPVHIVADAKERGLRLVPIEKIKYRGRNLGMWPVVETQVQLFCA